MTQAAMLDKSEMYDIKYALVKSLTHSCPRYKDKRDDGSMYWMTRSLLTDSSEGSRKVTVHGVEMQAYNIGVIDWFSVQRICAITEEFDPDALDEGMQFIFELHSSLEDIALPDCDCTTPQGWWEISSTIHIEGNSYDSNADTYATNLGVQAETMYLFWLTDQQKYGAVRKKYWLL